MIKKFRKKPVVIEAIRFTKDNWKEVESFTNNQAYFCNPEISFDGKSACIIPTLEGQHIATEGDWIIKGVKGEYYPCKPDIFEMTYESINCVWGIKPFEMGAKWMRDKIKGGTE